MPGTLLSCCLITLTVLASPAPAPPDATLPAPRRDEGFVGDASCVDCHGRQHASWHDSYHRTMTQAANPETVRGAFNVTLRAWGHQYSLERRGDEFWVVTDDPYWEMEEQLGWPFNPAKRSTYAKRVVQVTGSHHNQVYWVNRIDGPERFSLPFAWLIDEQRWVRRESNNLHPPDMPRLRGYWDSGCMRCHSTYGVPGLTEEGGLPKAAPRTVELGISCEACHGPAGQHVQAYQAWPVGAEGKPDNAALCLPDQLPKELSAMVCGHCHAVLATRDYDHYIESGSTYRPGDDLAKSHLIVRATSADDDPTFAGLLKEDPGLLEGSFWKDGSVRVSGREYNGLIESPCYQRGPMNCLSCHAMHGYAAPDDQLKAGMGGDRACVQCHAAVAEDVQAHTRHAPGSSGSACMNCHMPHTTYGLLKAIRSHTITSPKAADTAVHGKPNACNLCHLDQTLAWSASYLNQWYGQPVPEMTADQQTVPTGALWLLQADAGVRAIAAWAAGWEPARAASRAEALPPVLIQLLMDPYPAVRYLAARSLRAWPEYREMDYDFEGPSASREAVRATLTSAWQAAADAAKRPGLVDWETAIRLIRSRDQRPVFLRE